jgi:hypothetical protein
LGLTFDKKINWKEHIKDVKARATRKFTKKLVPHIVGLGPENTLADPPNDSLIYTLRYGEETYGSASCAVLMDNWMQSTIKV